MDQRMQLQIYLVTIVGEDPRISYTCIPFGEFDCENRSERIERLATSFGSYLVFAVTCGKLKPPKHILLPFAVKSLTSNTRLIRILNWFGHGV